MFSIKLAEHVFEIHNRYSYLEQICQGGYLTDEPGEQLYATDSDIEYENQDGGRWSDAYLESLAIFRKVCERLLVDDVILFHSSALSMDGRGYLFTAPSGTGKSTHARLWREYFGNRVVAINDDKPLLAIQSNSIIAYGTPFCGKEGVQNNTNATVSGIVILHQAPKNTIRQMTAKEAYPLLLNQTYRRNDPIGMIKTMDLVGRLLELPVYSLGCTISFEAVELVYQVLKGM